MIEFADLILKSGRAAIELALFILMPVMVLMLSFMRLLESRGLLQWLAGLVAPLLRPLGVPGLGVFAMLQVSFVSFAAPMATLALMDRQGSSERHIAATLAMVLGMAQANVIFPLAAVGLDVGTTLLVSLLGGVVAAGAAYHLFGRHLSAEEVVDAGSLESAPHRQRRSVLQIIQTSGREGVEIALSAIPMLVGDLFLVNLLRFTGAIQQVEGLTAPLFGVAAAVIAIAYSPWA